MLAEVWTKRGYYVHHVKEGLWFTFGINRIKPFKDNYTHLQMKAWKQNKDTRKVYDDLYMQSDPKDKAFDTYVTLIIKYVFKNEKERMTLNGIWVQSVLEAIFDVISFSAKVDSEIIKTWTDAIIDTEMVNIY